MIVNPPAMYRRRPSRTPREAPAPVALVLVKVSYDEGNWVRLEFDRAIDSGAIVGSAIIVDDEELSGRRYAATAGTVVTSPVAVRAFLTDIGPATGSGITLTASAGNGIVAADDGAAWLGVSGVAIPFG